MVIGRWSEPGESVFGNAVVPLDPHGTMPTAVGAW